MNNREIRNIVKKLCDSTKSGEFEGTWLEFQDVEFMETPIKPVDEFEHSCIYDEVLDKLIVDFSTESMTIELSDRWEKYCLEHDIPFDKFLILNTNAKHDREYLHTVQYFIYRCKNILNNKLPYPLAEEFGAGWDYAWDENYGKIDLNHPKEKIYNCLNYHYHVHRDFVYDWLDDNDLLKYGFVSYKDRGIELPSWYELDEVDGDNCDWSFGTFNPIVTTKSYFNVVTESHHEYAENDGLLISEKTCKALISQPFMVIGNCGLLEYLRENGFETYPELFDESYDNDGDPQKRIEIILEEVKRLCNMDKDELQKIYESVLWKVDHNRNNMKNYKEDPLIERLKKKYPLVDGHSIFNGHKSF